MRSSQLPDCATDTACIERLRLPHPVPTRLLLRIYTDIEDQCKHWDTALQEMIFAFEYLANPPKVHKKNDIKRMQTGLHLFAEYLPEMYNL